MSRFPETVAEAIDQVVIGEALHVEDLAEHIAAADRRAPEAVRSEVTIRAKFPVTRRTPVTDLPTQEIYHLIGHALANGTGARRLVGVEVRGLNACPCAQGLVRERARERLTRGGLRRRPDRRDLRAAARGDAQPAGRGDAHDRHRAARSTPAT